MKKRTKRIVFIIMLFAMLSAMPLVVLAEEAEVKQEVVTERKAASNSEPDNEELLMEYMENEVSVSSEAKASQYGYSHLMGMEKKLYELLLGKIEEVADGTITSTVFQFSGRDLGAYTARDLGLKTVMNGNVLSQEAKNALLKRFNSLNIDKLHNALLFDSPASLFWYDKTLGFKIEWKGSSSFQLVTVSGTGERAIAFSDAAYVRFSFRVAKEFAKTQKTDTFETSLDKIQSVQSAIETARSIVAEEAEKTDYYKLKAYKDRICDLTAYNYLAAKGGVSYGNPWQMIWVFDGDEDTNVVCEGYSKAFQFLCDASTFQNANVKSRIVCSRSHMWNVVTAGNGKNYLVDVTNCDSGMVGAPDRLFLAASVSGNLEDGYVFPCGDSRMFRYDDATLSFFDAAELEIAEKPCPVCSAGHMAVNDDAVEPTCTEPGLTEGSHCPICKVVTEKQKPIAASGHSWNKALTVDTPATCITEGSASIHCSACGVIQEGSSRTIKITDHRWGSGTITKKATAVEPGVRTYTCTCPGCKAKMTEPIPKIGWKKNPIRLSVAKKTFKKSELKKKKTFRIGVEKAKGEVTYTLNAKAKKAGIRVTSKGKVTIPKNCRKGTYKITVRAAGDNKYYKAGTKIITIKITGK